MRGWLRSQEVETERAAILAAWIVNGTYSAVARAQGGKRWRHVTAASFYKRPDGLSDRLRAEIAKASVTAADRDWLRSGKTEIRGT